MSELNLAAEEARLKADLAKLDAIVAQVRSEFNDPRLSIIDVVGIDKVAIEFAVLRRHAYRRLRDLKLLSYQRKEPVDV